VGTDWPVEPLDPMQGLYAAVTRESADGGPAGGWHPEEKVPLARALHDYTEGSAYAEHTDEDKGLLRPDMLADFVLVSPDLCEAEPASILRSRVEMTFVGGRCVYDCDA
jgi:predicted amidohydrolase YtcJ